MLKEFKEFALKGNVIDMAVGVIIGGAFSTIVSSLVNDIFMPVLGLLTGKIIFPSCIFRWMALIIRHWQMPRLSAHRFLLMAVLSRTSFSF